ncbi:hypothetical protein BBI17_009107, partial [Phytophthora kernoviae]
MDEVELNCAVYGEGSVFPVKIAPDAEVSALQKAILYKQRYNHQYNFAASALTLYLARRKEGEEIKWLSDGQNVVDFLRGDVDTAYKKMRSWWTLDDEEYFGANFQPGRKEIHVLVALPTQVAAPSGVAPSLPPTTVHRHPERLKRWAAINAMICQKNQNANQKTTSEYAKNTNKKRKNHDIDKSVGYSTLSWEDI